MERKPVISPLGLVFGAFMAFMLGGILSPWWWLVTAVFLGLWLIDLVRFLRRPF
ncbi:MAG: hypothetical protein KatS3mg119_2168 [Rhodothalassiaceae bacterium]|nr:MAG: hypothetical protein KatS3mg119_2168 [Rhodothalassiaceae bacterium]